MKRPERHEVVKQIREGVKQVEKTTAQIRAFLCKEYGANHVKHDDDDETKTKKREAAVEDNLPSISIFKSPGGTVRTPSI